MPRQVIEGFEEEFESISKKKANLEAEKKAELERVENLFKERETKISKLLELISFEVPEEVVEEEVTEEPVDKEEKIVEETINENPQEVTEELAEVESLSSEEVLTSAFGKIRFA